MAHISVLMQLLRLTLFHFDMLSFKVTDGFRLKRRVGQLRNSNFPDYPEAVATIVKGNEPLLEKVQRYLDWAASSPRYRHSLIWTTIRATDLPADAERVQQWFNDGMRKFTPEMQGLALDVGDCPEIYSLSAYRLSGADSEGIIKGAINEAELSFHSDDLEESIDWDSFTPLSSEEVCSLPFPRWEEIAYAGDGNDDEQEETSEEDQLVDSEGSYAMWYGFAVICSIEAAKAFTLPKGSPAIVPFSAGFDQAETLLGVYEDGQFKLPNYTETNLQYSPALQISEELLKNILSYVISSLSKDQSYSDYAMKIVDFAKDKPEFQSYTIGIVAQAWEKNDPKGTRLKMDFELVETWIKKALSENKEYLTDNNLLFANMGWLPEGFRISLGPNVESSIEILNVHVRKLKDVIWHDYPVNVKPVAQGYLLLAGLFTKALHTALLKQLDSNGRALQKVIIGFGDVDAELNVYA